ncbi:outer membrane lipoprotein carrier protein LolA [bacterium]|nr:outer membrane lipoprotein carrier protein LolA [bacterium]
MNKLLLLLFFTLSLSAAPPQKDVADYAENIKKSSATIATLSASFVQKKYLSALEDVVIAKGIFSLKKPDKIRWQYSSPFLYTITINGTVVSMKDDKKTSQYDMKQNSAFQNLNAIISGSFDGSILTKKELFTAHFSKEKNLIKLELTPRDKKFTLKKITIYFDDKEWLTQRVILTEQNRDYTDISFVDITKNKKVSDAIFTP